jgi:hypothetical protein
MENAAEALEGLHRGFAGRELGQADDLAIELVAPLQLADEQRVILAEHESIGGLER